MLLGMKLCVMLNSYSTYLLGCKDIDVLAIAGGSELSDVCLVGARGRRELQRNIPHQYGVGGVNNMIL